MADSEDSVGLVMRGDGQLIAAARLARNGGVQPKGRVLVGDDILHHAGGAGQLLAGVGIGEDDFQRALRVRAGQVKLQPDGVQVLIIGKDLGGAVAWVEQLGLVEVVAKGLGAALAQLRAHGGQPDGSGSRKQDHECDECSQQRTVILFFGSLGHGGLRMDLVRQRETGG